MTKFMRRLIKNDRRYRMAYETESDARAARQVKLDAVDNVDLPEEDFDEHPDDFSAQCASEYWTDYLGKPVWYIEPETIMMVLNEHGRRKRIIKVLHENKVGWIFNYPWAKFEPIG